MIILLTSKVGAIYIFFLSKCEISNGTFDSNTADLGGALYIESDVNLTFRYSDFMNNHAGLHGGSIYGTEFVKIDLQNSTFYSNSAVDGGAVWLKFRSVLKVRNANFTRNQALINGGALSMETNVNGTFVSCHFRQNWAKMGGVFAQKDNTNILIRKIKYDTE